MKWNDIELYLLVGVFLFTVWFVINTIKYYFGKKRKLKQLHRFAREGEVDAQMKLAKHYHHGDMVKKSCQNAAFWYQKAAFSGDEEAQSHLKSFLAEHRSSNRKDKC
ncbi:MAG: hypothetical protein DSZ10_01315 [Sulfurovum sp.]|nr:MAG: hypothetical protein DSZ10_01315 [Sulfurovum sp.]